MPYEWRTYHAADGRMAALHTRFAEHGVHARRLCERHGLRQVARFVSDGSPPGPPRYSVDLGRDLPGFAVRDGSPAGSPHYLLPHPDRAARDAAWAPFRADAERVRAQAESERDGPLVERAPSVSPRAACSPEP